MESLVKTVQKFIAACGGQAVELEADVEAGDPQTGYLSHPLCGQGDGDLPARRPFQADVRTIPMAGGVAGEARKYALEIRRGQAHVGALPADGAAHATCGEPP